MNAWQKMYQEKLTTADKAVKVVKDGDNVEYSHFVTLPYDLDKALAKRKKELKHVHVRCNTLMFVPEVFQVDPKGEVFDMTDISFSAVTRGMAKNGIVNYNPLVYHELPLWYDNRIRGVDVLFLAVTPMDENGFFNMSTTCSSTMDIIRCKGGTAKNLKVILEVNRSLPFIHGENNIHISQVDTIVESTANPPLHAIPPVSGDETDMKIAKIIMNEMEDGACLQLGIGGMPNLVGKMIAQSDLKDLGCHTEMFVDAYMDMFEAGRLTNNAKTLDKGKSTFTFAMGSERLYQFMNNNPSMNARSVTYTNDPHVIAQNDKVFSICSCIAVDIQGNISSESAGYRQISGTGGQLDFHYASFHSNGGKGFLCTHSTKKLKDGTVISNIVPYFKVGTAITVPSNLVNYVVTENGIVNLKGLSLWERAEALIGLAHPDFREDLIKQAEIAGVWRRSNKR